MVRTWNEHVDGDYVLFSDEKTEVQELTEFVQGHVAHKWQSFYTCAVCAPDHRRHCPQTWCTFLPKQQQHLMVPQD